MECFLCAVKNVLHHTHEKNDAVTEYQGTPLCAVHAKEVFQRLQEGFINGHELVSDGVNQAA